MQNLPCATQRPNAHYNDANGFSENGLGYKISNDGFCTHIISNHSLAESDDNPKQGRPVLQE